MSKNVIFKLISIALAFVMVILFFLPLYSVSFPGVEKAGEFAGDLFGSNKIKPKVKMSSLSFFSIGTKGFDVASSVEIYGLDIDPSDLGGDDMPVILDAQPALFLFLVVAFVLVALSVATLVENKMLTLIATIVNAVLSLGYLGIIIYALIRFKIETGKLADGLFGIEFIRIDLSVFGFVAILCLIAIPVLSVLNLLSTPTSRASMGGSFYGMGAPQQTYMQGFGQTYQTQGFQQNSFANQGGFQSSSYSYQGGYRPQQQTSCPGCGEPLVPGASFCGKCGSIIR